MTFPRLLALSTGVPANCFRQEDITALYTDLLTRQTGTKRERTIRAAMRQSGVESRYSVIDAAFFDEVKSTQQRNDRYMAEAVPLGKRVIADGLESVGVSPHEIDSLIVVSCTGFSVPGLDLLLAQQLGMSSSLARTQIFGMGCYGAFPGIRRAFDSAVARPGSLTVMLALELCTLHLQFDDTSESVVSSSLFADGAAMVLIGTENGGLPAPHIVDAETYCDFQTMGDMTFTLTDQGFRMYLSSYVPDLLAANVVSFVDRLLVRSGLTRKDVRFWAIHPGSKRIIEYLQAQLELTPEQVEFSLDTLRDFGNMSSATVLFVLDRMMREADPAPGDYLVMMAFGPGLTMEALLLRWCR